MEQVQPNIQSQSTAFQAAVVDSEPPMTADLVVHGIAVLISNGQMASAHEMLDLGMQLYPNHLGILKIGALLHQSIGNWDQAMALLSSIRSMESPLQADTCIQLVRVSMCLGQADEALQLAQDLQANGHQYPELDAEIEHLNQLIQE